MVRPLLPAVADAAGTWRDEAYASIYIASSLTIPEVRRVVERATGGRPEMFTIVSDALVVSVRKNGYARSDGRVETWDFVTYPYLAEVEPSGGVERPAYISAFGDLLRALWGEGILTVAACDLEEELPDNGGRDRVAPTGGSPVRGDGG